MKGGIYRRFGKPVVRYKGVYQTCESTKEAEEILTGLRFKDYEGTFDRRDYAKGNPLGFQAQAERWLSYRRDEVKSHQKMVSHIRRAYGVLGTKSIKEIGFADLEDFLRSLPATLSGKSRKNIFTTLHTFFVWVSRREGIPVPLFPEIKFTLKWRNTVSRTTQATIIEEVRRISFAKNPRVWFGINLLANFPKVRPGELIQIKEGDIDRGTGEVWIRNTKEGHAKRIYLLPEDLEFLGTLPKSFPEMPFFRHDNKWSGQFGKDYLYSWWKRACANLGIVGVDLYGGTKHSTVTAAREFMSPEEIRRYVTEHQTNAAFDRYLQVDAQKQREASRTIREMPTQVSHKDSVQEIKGKVLKFQG